jgi:hypothetical protein
MGDEREKGWPRARCLGGWREWACRWWGGVVWLHTRGEVGCVDTFGWISGDFLVGWVGGGGGGGNEL